MTSERKSRTFLDGPEMSKKKAEPDDSEFGLTINFDECVDEFCELAKVLTFRPKPKPPAP